MKTLTKGIIVGSDFTQEYLLNYFYINFRRHSDLPITFFDFGMTKKAREFCEKRGKLIRIDETLMQVRDHLKLDIKKIWLKKPIAFSQAPYDINLWIDIDCKIMGPIDEIFDLLKPCKEIAIYKEHRLSKACQRFYYLLPKKNIPGYAMFNSGVVLFRKNASFLIDWIRLCKKEHSIFRGDQEVLSKLLSKKPHLVKKLPEKFNQSVFEICKERAQILHFCSQAKENLMHEYILLLKQSIPAATRHCYKNI